MIPKPLQLSDQENEERPTQRGHCRCGIHALRGTSHTAFVEGIAWPVRSRLNDINIMLTMRAFTLAVCLLALGCHVAVGGRSLQQDNPFLTPQGALTPVPAPPPSVEPVADPGTAIAPAPEDGDPCACTADGFSGSVNTSRIGCGQWDIVAGSNAFTCYVEVRGCKSIEDSR